MLVSFISQFPKRAGVFHSAYLVGGFYGTSVFAHLRKTFFAVLPFFFVIYKEKFLPFDVTRMLALILLLGFKDFNLKLVLTKI